MYLIDSIVFDCFPPLSTFFPPYLFNNVYFVSSKCATSRNPVKAAPIKGHIQRPEVLFMGQISAHRRWFLPGCQHFLYFCVPPSFAHTATSLLLFYRFPVCIQKITSSSSARAL
jgi:hypothetical protein